MGLDRHHIAHLNALQIVKKGVVVARHQNGLTFTRDACSAAVHISTNAPVQDAVGVAVIHRRIHRGARNRNAAIAVPLAGVGNAAQRDGLLFRLFLCGPVIFRIGQGLGCLIKQVLGLGFHHASFHKPLYQRVVRCGKHLEHDRQQRQRDQRKQQWHYHQPCRTFAQKIVLVRHLFFLPVQAQAAAHT